MTRRSAQLVGALVVVALGIAAFWPWSTESNVDKRDERGAKEIEDVQAPKPLVVEPETALVLDTTPARDEPSAGMLDVNVFTTMDHWESDERAPNAKLVIRARKTGPPLATFLTASNGTALVELPEKVVYSKRQVWVTLEADGILPPMRSRPIHRRAGGAYVLKALFFRGTMLEGSLVAPGGRPARGTVDIWTPAGDRLIHRESITVRDDGRFSTPLLAEGPHKLTARSASLGNGATQVFNVMFSGTLPHQTIRLSGTGVLRGKLVDERGEPVQRPIVAVIHTSTPNPTFALTDRVAMLEREGLGRAWIRADVGTDGTFTLEGLRAGLYELGFETGTYRLSKIAPITDTPILADGTRHEWTVHRPRLRIRVRNADGSQVGASFDKHEKPHWMESVGWPTDVGLSAFYDGEPGVRSLWSNPTLAPRRVARGEFVLDAIPDTTVHLGIYGGAVPWTTQRIDVPHGTGTIDVDFVIPDGHETGRVSVEAQAPDGSQITDQVRTRFIDPATGAVLIEREFRSWDDTMPLTFTLPVGAYDVEVEGLPLIDTYHGTFMGGRVHGSFSTTVDVQPNAEESITAQLTGTARLSVTVLGEPTRDEIAIADHAPLTNRVIYDDNDIKRVDVTIGLEKPGRWPTRVSFRREWGRRTSGAGTHLLPFVAFGTTDTSEPLTPGSYTLIATTPSGRTLRREVTLEPGKTLDVSLSFD